MVEESRGTPTPLHPSQSRTAEAVSHAYDAVAPSYDRWHWQKFWKRNERPEIEAALCTSPPTSTIVDLGTGTGIYLDLLCATGNYVVGIDLSEKMLIQAQRKAPLYVSLIQADVTRIPLKSDSVGTILGARVLSHVRHPVKFFSEIRRVAMTGATALVTDVHPYHAYDRVRIRTAHMNLSVETHKHPLDQLVETAERNQLQLVERREYTVDELRWLPKRGFTSIDRTGMHPIFYRLKFRAR